MHLVNATNIVLLFWLALEVITNLTNRVRAAAIQDAGTFRSVWVSVAVAFLLADVTEGLTRNLSPKFPSWVGFIGLLLLVFGIGFRHYAIRVLGRFFTARVMIQKNHTLVQEGPYRLLRHPTYTGAWIAFIGVGLTTRNLFAALIFTFIPLIGLLRRIHVEERVLHEAFGESYKEYAKHTWRLFPFLY
ncbi:hypothetical protein BM613_11925 [Sulfoacidibacillus thermotolerans]|uniref:Steroid 5-alpha reductase C-terminal domain-containing protein n=1 Tax=Sulfoacidibacillus thermotolerans TaxID=1765684 RepID=A0A2U3D692_SULT2|nr:hypothetical protein BM613_11925 [Sulfoacidibacillus thermotolerans]